MCLKCRGPEPEFLYLFGAIFISYHFKERVSEIVRYCLANLPSISYHTTNATQNSMPPSPPNIPIQCVTDASTPSTPLTLALISCHFSNSCLGCTFTCEEIFECLTEAYICWQIFLLLNVYFIFLKEFPLIKNFKVRKMKKTLKKSEVN